MLASNNAGKLQELHALLDTSEFLVCAQSEYAVPSIAETGLSFVENAILKARNAAGHSGLPALADDSGLEVDVLDGAPGIHSARYAGPTASDLENTQKLLQALTDIPQTDRTARYQCVIVYLRHTEDPTPLICQGTWDGWIVDEPQGHNGFGYDPIFFVPTHGCTAAQLDAGTKNRLSHRGQALNQLLGELS